MIPAIQYTSNGIVCVSCQLPSCRFLIASASALARLQNVVISSALAKIFQHRTQTSAPEIWLICTRVFLALVKTVVFIWFFTCSELCWHLLRAHYEWGILAFRGGIGGESSCNLVHAPTVTSWEFLYAHRNSTLYKTCFVFWLYTWN